MTTPKLFTEKELEEMEERLYFKGEESHGYHCQSGYGGECKCGYGVARIVIKEFKRLRAGQAREKILRDEILEYEKLFNDISDWPGEYRTKGNYESESVAKAVIDRGLAIRNKFKQADAVKDGPSEEDKAKLKRVIDFHKDHLHRLDDPKNPRECIECWSFSKLQKEWGIE